MKKIAAIPLLSIAMVLPTVAQNKMDNRLGDSAEVLSQILAKPDEIPHQLLNRSRCVLVFPSVKRVAVGIGGSYGRGAIVCRTGPDMTGPWSAPAMYKLNVASLGVQLGSSSTDYVLLVQTPLGAEKVLSGKLKLGSECSAVAGPTGAKALAANDPKVDVLTYSRASGLFAGASLGSADLSTDDEGNTKVYGRTMSANQIVRENQVQTTDAGKRLVNVLKRASPKWSGS